MSTSVDGVPATLLAPGVSEEEVAKLRRDLGTAVRSVCPAWLADRSDDLVQTATLRALDVLRRREGNEPLSTFYLRRTAYSAVVDEIRRWRRRRETVLEQDATSAAELVTEDAGPERRAASHELGRAIRACLAVMVAPRRSAVTLHLLGHTVPEVARLLGASAKRAENLVYRGLADLRTCLTTKGFGR